MSKTERVNCNLCGANKTKTLYLNNIKSEELGKVDAFFCTNSNFGQHGQIVKCLECSLVYTNPRSKETDIAEVYSKVIDNKYLEEKDGRLLTFQKSLKEVEKYKTDGKLLDVGCATGIFLEVANKHGWETYGIEPSKWAANYAKEKLGLNVIAGTLEETDFPKNSFDVITMWDVLEHFSNPLQELEKANSLLKDDGLLFLTTMNMDSPFAKLMGKRWWWLMEMHLYYFSPTTIEKMLRKAGFELVRISSHTRIVRFKYLISRLEHYNKHLTAAMHSIGNTLNLNGLPIPINFGDLMTVCARKSRQ